MTISQSYYANQIATQIASLSIAPIWYPFLAKSLYQRSQIIESRIPGDLSHSNFFRNKCNYYRGFTASLIVQPLYPITDWVLGTLLNQIQQIRQREPNLAERVSAGFITGTTTVILANPYDVIILAAQKHTEGPYKTIKRVIKYSGIKGLYTGAVPMAIRNGTFVSNLLVTTPAVQKKIYHFIPGDGKWHEVVTMALASTLPASIYICVSVPLDFMAIMRQSDRF